MAAHLPWVVHALQPVRQNCTGVANSELAGAKDFAGEGEGGGQQECAEQDGVTSPASSKAGPSISGPGPQAMLETGPVDA